MTIYGTAILAFCFLAGKLLGNLLGLAIGINGDVGGVGFAMFFLVLAHAWMKKAGKMPHATEEGIHFWGKMYIPIVIAMAMSLNVKAALSGGMVALIAGVVVTLGSFALVPALSRIGKEKEGI